MRLTLSLAASILSMSLLFGGPSIADAKAPPAKNFGVLPAIYDAAISPDGSEYASIINIGGQYVISVGSLTGGQAEPRLVGLEADVKPGYIKWVNNDAVILSFEQNELDSGLPYQVGYLYRLDTKKMKGRILIKPEGIFRQFNNIVVDWLENDPDHILMSFDDRSNNVQPSIRKVNINSGNYTRVKGALTGVQHWYTDNDGNPRAGQGRLNTKAADWVLKIKDATDGEWRDSEAYPGISGTTVIHGFTSNPDEMIISSYQGQDTVGLYIYNLKAKKITRKLYHNDRYDATGVVLSGDGSEVIGARYVADTTETELLGRYDTTLQALRRKLSSHTVDFVDQSQDGSSMIVKVSNPYDPGAMYLAKNGEIAASLGDMYPSLPSDEMGEVLSISYKARDGFKIPAYVTLPPAITDTAQLKNLPFIVLPHGGPYGRDTKRFDYFAQFFASRGYGVLQMNFRGSSGYGKAFKEAGRKNWVVMQEDVEDGARWLLAKGYADPDRMCIAGWSYGGYAALMGAAKNGDIYNCAISMAALTDIADFKNDLKRYRFGNASSKSFIGYGFESKDDVKANTPVKIAEDIKIPLFLAHGTQDQQVHFDQYSRMKSALKKSPAKVTYMKFKDEDHYLSNQKNRQEFFTGLEKFLIQANGPSEYMNK